MAAPEVVIAILGVTGAGKSSLVKRVTKRSDIYVEDGLSSGMIPSRIDICPQAWSNIQQELKTSKPISSNTKELILLLLILLGSTTVGIQMMGK